VPPAFQEAPDAHPEGYGVVEEQENDRGQEPSLDGETHRRDGRKGLESAPEERIPQRRVGTHEGVLQFDRLRGPALDLETGDGADDGGGHVGVGVEPLQVPVQQRPGLGIFGTRPFPRQGSRGVGKTEALHPREIPRGLDQQGPQEDLCKPFPVQHLTDAGSLLH